MDTTINGNKNGMGSFGGLTGVWRDGAFFPALIPVRDLFSATGITFVDQGGSTFREASNVPRDGVTVVPVFKAGDVVRLKSGGPDMTVEGIVKSECEIVNDARVGDVRVCWFQSAGRTVAAIRDDDREYGDISMAAISPSALCHVR